MSDFGVSVVDSVFGSWFSVPSVTSFDSQGDLALASPLQRHWAGHWMS